jgi:hypothetical protein
MLLDCLKNDEIMSRSEPIVELAEVGSVKATVCDRLKTLHDFLSETS